MKQIGKYTVVETLGQGGMGTVYKGMDPYIGREVAIKMIQDQVLHVPEIKRRFYTEARSAGRLSHENITVVYDVGEDQGRPFIVMEFLSGTDLNMLMENHHPLSLELILSIAVQTCAGLYYAHQHNIIHRDVKPGNVRVLDNGRVKIMDFGLARIESADLTQTHSRVGTPQYMSPEQIRGDKVDHRTDIFSFGVILYEMLTGIRPFSGDHMSQVIYNILDREPAPINYNDPRLAPDLQVIVSRCLTKEPGQRYQSFAEVIQDLKKVRIKQKRSGSGQPVPAPNMARAKAKPARAKVSRPPQAASGQPPPPQQPSGPPQMGGVPGQPTPMNPPQMTPAGGPPPMIPPQLPPGQMAAAMPMQPPSAQPTMPPSANSGNGMPPSGDSADNILNIPERSSKWKKKDTKNPLIWKLVFISGMIGFVLFLGWGTLKVVSPSSDSPTPEELDQTPATVAQGNRGSGSSQAPSTSTPSSVTFQVEIRAPYGAISSMRYSVDNGLQRSARIPARRSLELTVTEQLVIQPQNIEMMEVRINGREFPLIDNLEPDRRLVLTQEKMQAFVNQ